MNLRNIKIGDLVLFKTKFEDLEDETVIGFIHAMNNKYFTIGVYQKRVILFLIPWFESLVHYNNIINFKIVTQ